MKKIIIICFTLFVSITFYNKLWAWNDTVTHRDLSKIAAQKSQLADESYIKDIGYEEGLELVQDKGADDPNAKIPLWIEHIKDGVIEEDAGNIITAYYYHHFHNPLALSWNQAGLSTYYPWINGMSSILWAQNTSNPWSWQKAREYYYTALTGMDYSGNIVAGKTQRDAYFANTFKGLGHVIHLIQDSAQPAHVRNDPHALDDIGIVPQFENWAKNNRTTASSLMSNPVFSTVSFNASAEAGYIPITQFWDINQYDGSNPPSGTAIGLSEYTNANFFSEDTINNTNFPNPKPSDTTTTIVERNFTNTFWNTTYPRQYYLKNCCGETKGNQGYLLSAVDYLDYYRLQYPSLSFALPKIPVLDDNVYSDYASLLLPRAVGYSASLINYFFRGQINMEKDPNNSSQYVIKNESDEYMSGNFTLYYDDVSGNRKYLTSWNKSINAKSTSDSVSIAEPTDMKEKGKYILVFQGTMGNETGAVVGRILELKKGVGRVVGVSGNNITVYMEDGGTITGSLPTLPAGMTYSRAISVRFDLADWNTFVVLTKYCDEPGCRNGYYAFHKYSINTNKTLIYHGVVFTEKIFPSMEITTTIEDGEPPDSGIQNKTAIFTTKVSYFNCIDFFFKEGRIKPFGAINKIDHVNKMDYQLFWAEEFNTWEMTDWYMYNYVSEKRSVKIYYGGVVEEMVLKECIGHNDCQNYVGEGYAYPLGIFNETDYAFIQYAGPRTDVGDYVITTLPRDIASSLAFIGKYTNEFQIKTTLREVTGKYSYYQQDRYIGSKSTLAVDLTQYPGILAPKIRKEPYNEPTIKEALNYYPLWMAPSGYTLKSYSSEIEGAMNCQNILIVNSISDNEGYYLAWKAGGFVKFKNCTDWKLLEGGGFAHVFDVSVTD